MNSQEALQQIQAILQAAERPPAVKARKKTKAQLFREDVDRIKASYFTPTK